MNAFMNFTRRSMSNFILKNRNARLVEMYIRATACDLGQSKALTNLGGEESNNDHSIMIFAISIVDNSLSRLILIIDIISRF